MDQKLRASQYFSTDTHSTDSSISSIHAFMLKEYRKSVTNFNNFHLNKEVNRDIPNNFETRPETPESQDKKSYIGMETDRRNYLKSNFPTTFSRRYSVASVSSSEVGKIETEDIATSLLTSDTDLFQSVSNHKIPEGLSLEPSPSKQKSIDVYRNFSNSDFNHKDLMTLHYIFSNSEYDSCDHEMNDEFSEYSLGEINETQGHQKISSDKSKQKSVDEDSTKYAGVSKKLDLSNFKLNTIFLKKNEEKSCQNFHAQNYELNSFNVNENSCKEKNMSRSKNPLKEQNMENNNILFSYDNTVVGNRNFHCFYSTLEGCSNRTGLINHVNGQVDNIRDKTESKATEDYKNAKFDQYSFKDQTRYQYNTVPFNKHIENSAVQDKAYNYEFDSYMTKSSSMNPRLCNTPPHCNFIFDGREKYHSDTYSRNNPTSTRTDGKEYVDVNLNKRNPYLLKDSLLPDIPRERPVPNSLDTSKGYTWTKRNNTGGVNFDTKLQFSFNGSPVPVTQDFLPETSTYKHHQHENISNSIFPHKNVMSNYECSKNVKNTRFRYSDQHKVAQYHEISLLDSDTNNIVKNSPELEDFKRKCFENDTRNFNKAKDVVNFVDNKVMFNGVERVKIEHPILQQISMERVAMKEHQMRKLYQPITIRLTKSDIESELRGLYGNRIHKKFCVPDDYVLLLPTRMYPQPITYILPHSIES